MRVSLPYGTQSLSLDVPGSSVTELEPRLVPGLSDERAAFSAAVAEPLECRPLAQCVHATDRVAVVIADITRPLPSRRLLPWLLEELGHVAPERFTIIVGTGSHRKSTPSERAQLVGPELLQRVTVVDHDAHAPESLAFAGRASDGRSISMNRHYVEADRRIVLGFLEPHFMAGFSGGYKGIFPAVADIESIQHYHRASVIADPKSTWAVLDGNPTQQSIVRYGSVLPLDFCINVALNRHHAITGIFAGDPVAVHKRGAAFVKRETMLPCPHAFPIVVTTNGGYPLDQNLYQAVKGMSAAAQIVAPGGLIVIAAKCNDGFPQHGNFRRLLREYPEPNQLLAAVDSPGFAVFDQWQAQLLALVRQKARIALYSEIATHELPAGYFEPVEDMREFLLREVAQHAASASVAVLTEGPLSVPYLQPSVD